MDTDSIKNEIRVLLNSMGFGGDIDAIEMHQGSAVRYSVYVRGKVSMLIGERGNNLIALEHILKKIISKKNGEEEQRFTLDINDYRMQRLEELKQDVKNAAKEVRLYNRESPLRPMSSFERRIVHLLLAEYPDITTESVGADQERRVIIKPYP
ncbi:MAG: R3H domain-containing nucleic acid-binding protein [bacterium]|nr:R3H domain-containing nucleic acid-binding protein [bacterium]